MELLQANCYARYSRHARDARDARAPRYKPIEIFVRVESARNLVAADKGGTSDPYAKLKLDGHEYRTSTVKKTIDPVWDQEFAWRGKQSMMLAQPLNIKVFDNDALSRDDKLGEAQVELNSLVERYIRYIRYRSS